MLVAKVPIDCTFWTAFALAIGFFMGAHQLYTSARNRKAHLYRDMREYAGAVSLACGGLIVIGSYAYYYFAIIRVEQQQFEPHLARLIGTSASAPPLSGSPAAIPSDLKVVVAVSKGGLSLSNEHRSVKDQHRANKPEEATGVLVIDWGPKIETKRDRDVTINGHGKRSYTSEHWNVRWSLVDLKRNVTLRAGLVEFCSDSGPDVRKMVPELFP